MCNLKLTTIVNLRNHIPIYGRHRIFICKASYIRNLQFEFVNLNIICKSKFKMQIFETIQNR